MPGYQHSDPFGALNSAAAWTLESEFQNVYLCYFFSFHILSTISILILFSKLFRVETWTLVVGSKHQSWRLTFGEKLRNLYGSFATTYWYCLTPGKLGRANVESNGGAILMTNKNRTDKASEHMWGEDSKSGPQIWKDRPQAHFGRWKSLSPHFPSSVESRAINWTWYQSCSSPGCLCSGVKIVWRLLDWILNFKKKLWGLNGSGG